MVFVNYEKRSKGITICARISPDFCIVQLLKDTFTQSFPQGLGVPGEAGDWKDDLKREQPGSRVYRLEWLEWVTEPERNHPVSCHYCSLLTAEMPTVLLLTQPLPRRSSQRVESCVTKKRREATVMTGKIMLIDTISLPLIPVNLYMRNFYCSDIMGTKNLLPSSPS